MFLSARVVCRIVWRENHRISVTNQIFFGRHPTSQIINTCNLMQLTAVSAVFLSSIVEESYAQNDDFGIIPACCTDLGDHMAGYANSRWNYPPSFCNRDEVYVCCTILNQYCMVKKNTNFISTRTTLIPACNLYFLFFHSFLINDLWWNLCQFRTRIHYICE